MLRFLTSDPQKSRRITFLIGRNLLSFVLILALVAVVGEVWLRWQQPFPRLSAPVRFVPRVGRMLEPDTEVRWTNFRDFWTVSRTNRWGFLDREPIGPERAAASCHVALIGDSFVAAGEVPIADKSHVRLEELAARVLPELDVTTSAFGISNTGQINQLPLYDEFARRLRPRLLVLVFVINDFANNFRDRRTWTTARRNADGGMRLLPPDPDRRRPSRPVADFVERLVGFGGFEHSWFANRLQLRLNALDRFFAPLDEMEEWRRAFEARGGANFRLLKDLPPLPDLVKEKDPWEFTAFGFDQFKERADRDEVSLAILSTHTMGTRGHPPFDRLNALAAARGIPVIDQFDHILSAGGGGGGPRPRTRSGCTTATGTRPATSGRRKLCSTT